MRSTVKIVLAAAICGSAAALVAEALQLGSTLQIVALLVAMLAASLVDPVRFWATDEFPPQTRLGGLLLRTPRQPR